MDELVRISPRYFAVTIWPKEMEEADPGGDAGSFCVGVHYVGDDQWQLSRGLGHGRGPKLTATGWNFERPLRVPLDQAVALATSWAPRIQCMDITAAECLDWHRKGCPR